MKSVAVLGGGPAGAMAAETLAGGGLKTLLLDEKLAWEKPCGGGITFKAYKEYPFLIQNSIPKKTVKEVHLSAPKAGTVRMIMPQAMVIYSRLDLNRMLLERAEASGARIEKTRVTELSRTGRGWAMRTRHGTIETDYCVVATGARNTFRDVGTRLTPSDTMIALGYWVPSNQEHIDIQFASQLEGYIWVFPRCGHLSVGICGKGLPAPVLRARLEAYLQERGISYRGAAFYCHLLPALDTPAWCANRIAGDGWLAVGDAGGLVDPITGEGLYYAMRSGDLAGRVILADQPHPEKADTYRSVLDRDFAADLAFGAHLARRFFHSRFLWGSVPSRMVQFMRRSQTFHGLMQDLFAGTQRYLDLKSRLLRNLHGTLREVILNALFHKSCNGEFA